MSWSALLITFLAVLCVVGLIAWAGGPEHYRGDEVGNTARAASTFKENLIRIERMELEQREAEKRAEAQRKAELRKLADSFSVAIEDVVGAVFSAAAELEAAAGTLTMLYQLSASVAQVGFGHLADRWRPRVLVMAGPVVSVVVLSFIGATTTTCATPAASIHFSGMSPRRVTKKSAPENMSPMRTPAMCAGWIP